MKKITLFLFALFSCWQISAQVSSYGFSHFLGSYIENSASATAIPGVRADSFISTAQNIGFDFVYDGVTYTQFKMSSNGIISFNMTGTNSLTGNDLSTDNPTSRPIIAPLWDDLDGANPASSLASYEVTGSAPNRVLTVEWRNWEWNYASSTPVISFQVKLHETTNVIEFVYRQEATNVNSGSATIGIGSPTGSGAGSFLSLSSVASPTVSSTTSTNNINTKPATGQIYRFTPPSCFAPNSLAVSNISTSSATISWNGVSPAPSNGYEYYYSDVNTVPSASGTTTSSLTTNLTGLNSGTTYYVWLRSNCGGIFSSWNGPFRFVTDCNSVTSFTQNFDGVTAPALPGCFLKVGTTGSVNTQTTNPSSPANTLYFYSSSTTNRAVLRLQNVSNLGAGTHRLKFKMRASSTVGGVVEVGYLTNPSDASTFISLETVTASSLTYTDYAVTPSAGTYTDYIAIRHTGSPSNSVLIDDISWDAIPAIAPTCSTITFPSNGALNVPNTRVSWSSSLDATGYRISVGYGSGTTEVLNSFDVGNVLSYTFPYEAATTYYVTVYPYNAFGVATGCSEISFTTCDISTDFVQNFESTTGTNFPDCWAKVGNSGTAYTQANTGISGARNLYMYSSSTTSRPVVAIQSVSNANAGTHRMRMKVRGNFTAGESIEFGYLVNPSDATTFTSISSIVTNSTTTAQDFVIVPLGMPAGNVVFALRTGTATYSVLIDDVAWEPIPAVVPTCVAITSPTDQAINVTNSRVSWSTSLEATGYKISVGYQSGATDVLNMFDVGNVTSYVVPTDPGTTYFVTVYPYNSFGTATGCSEISFTTCDALFPDVTETFATFLPSCWLNMTGGDLVTGPTSTTGSGWVADGFANNGTTGAVRNEIWTTGANDWLISPLVTIPASGYELRFDAAATQYATSNAPTTAWEADDFIQVLVSTGFSNWTVLYTYDNTNQPGITATSNIINLDTYAGMDVRFAFRAVEGTANGSADIDFFIDNFNVRLTPASAPSCATNIVATPNATCGNFATVITWDAAVSADGYNIAIGTTPGTGNVFSGNLGNVLTYSFIGNIGTTYYYTIVPYNAFGSATGCTEQSFATNVNGCYCVSAPTSVDGDGITNILLGSVNFPNTVSTSPVYNDHTATVVDMSRGVNNNVQISFNVPSWEASYDYNTVVWIDVNDNFAFEASEIVFTGVSPTNVAPTSLNASFVMPSTVPLGQHRMRIVATDNAQNPANPCYSGTYGETVDFIINVVAPSCTPPVATASVVYDCLNSQFSVNVNVTDLGNGSPVITNGTTNWPVTATGIQNVGPFAFGTAVTLTLLHGTDALCNIPLGTFNYGGCPPVNDDCANATVLTPGSVFNTNSLVGTNSFATASTGAPAPTCANYAGGDVWYSVTVPASGNITVELNSASGSPISDTGLSVYSGTCGSLVEIDCDDDSSDDGSFSLVSLTGRTPGEVLFVRAWEYGNNSFGTFLVSAYDASLSSSTFDTNSFMAYPNPVKDVLNVSYSTEISSIRVINMIGQEVISRNVNASSTQVDMSELSAGTYIVNVTLGDAVKTLKVVKQ